MKTWLHVVSDNMYQMGLVCLDGNRDTVLFVCRENVWEAVNSNRVGGMA